MLVDHAEQARACPGVEKAEIVEILDHHHIGSIETRVPVAATFDPVGSTATLVVERFRAERHASPSDSTAMLLLGAILSDTVILNSPTTTDRDRAVVEYLEELLGFDAREFGREMFEATSRRRPTSPPGRDHHAATRKEYQLRHGQTVSIAQIETVGSALERRDELLRRARGGPPAQRLRGRRADGHRHRQPGHRAAVAGDRGALERAFGERPGRRHRAPGRDEPQEAGRAEAARRDLDLNRRQPVRLSGGDGEAQAAVAIATSVLAHRP